MYVICALAFVVHEYWSGCAFVTHTHTQIFMRICKCSQLSGVTISLQFAFVWHFSCVRGVVGLREEDLCMCATYFKWERTSQAASSQPKAPFGYTLKTLRVHTKCIQLCTTFTHTHSFGAFYLELEYFFLSLNKRRDAHRISRKPENHHIRLHYAMYGRKCISVHSSN